MCTSRVFEVTCAIIRMKTKIGWVTMDELQTTQGLKDSQCNLRFPLIVNDEMFTGERVPGLSIYLRGRCQILYFVILIPFFGGEK